jgi:hypothetical protein
MRVRRVDALSWALGMTAVFALAAAGCAARSPGRGVLATSSVATPASGQPVTAPSGTLWFIFLDDLHVDFRSTGYLRALLKTICTDLVQDGDMVAAVSTGPSSIAIDATYDRQRILKGIDKASGSSLGLADIFRSSQSVSQQPTINGNELLYRIAVSVSTASDTVIRLAQVKDPRKAFIYVSSGYYVDLPPEGTSTEPGVGPAVTRPNFKNVSMASVRDDLFRLMAEARRSNIKLFAIDTRRLPNSAQPDSSTDIVWWQNYWATTRNSLRALSERTGGFATLEEQDLVESLKRINSTVRN